jgi:hypothetical protein
MDELEDKTAKRNKIIRYSAWGIVLLVFTILASKYSPPESLDFVKDMAKEVIQLIILT